MKRSLDILSQAIVLYKGYLPALIEKAKVCVWRSDLCVVHMWRFGLCDVHCVCYVLTCVMFVCVLLIMCYDLSCCASCVMI